MKTNRSRRRLFAGSVALAATFCGTAISHHAGDRPDPASAPVVSDAAAGSSWDEEAAVRAQRPTRAPRPTPAPTTAAPAPVTTPAATAPTTAAPKPAPTTTAPAPKPAPTTQAPAAAPAPVVSSGTAVPQGDLPGWRQTLSEDFTKAAPLGSFASTYRGWAGYDGGTDTSGNGRYNSATTTSVHDGLLDKYLHSDGSSAQVMALTPPIASQTYGRYAVRFKMDQVPGYKVAWLLWPASDNWTQGELDFPEGSVGGKASGFAHDTSGNPSNNVWSVDTGMATTDWHTAVIEWAPGSLTYTMDGKSWTTNNARAIPTNPMRWVLQTETELEGGRPNAGSAGHIYIDWVATWARS